MSSEARELIQRAVDEEQEWYREHAMKKNHPHPQNDELGVYWIPSDDTIPMEYKIIENNDRATMSLVGGWLERVNSFLMPELDCGCKVVMMVNSEGVLNKLPLNRRASFLYPVPNKVFGDVFLVAEGPVAGLDEGSKGHVGLPPLYHHWKGPGNPLPTSS